MSPRNAATAQKNPAFGGADRLFGCVAMLAGVNKGYPLLTDTSSCAPRLPEKPICTHQTIPYGRELLWGMAMDGIGSSRFYSGAKYYF